MNNSIDAATILRNTAKYGLLILAVLISLFALVSGSESFEGGVWGVIQNSPNALPWLSLLILVGVAWQWELIGGVLITLGGIFMVYFFNFSGPNFFLLTFVITLIIPLLGVSLLISNYLDRKALK